MNYINFIYNHPGVFYYLAAIIIIIVISIWRKWYILDKKNLFRQKLLTALCRNTHHFIYLLWDFRMVG